MQSTMVPILPCTDLDAAEAFFARLGFAGPAGDRPGWWDGYRILRHPGGAALHLAPAAEGWLVPGRNPFGLYLYVEDVDGAAAAFPGALLGGDTAPRHTAWGTYEFAVNGPDDTLVRVGRPSPAGWQADAPGG